MFFYQQNLVTRTQSVQKMRSRIDKQLPSFFLQLQQHLHQQRLSLDIFLKQFTITKPTYLSYRQLINMTSRILVSLQSQSTDLPSLFHQLKGSNNLISIQTFKQQYYQKTHTIRHSSKSVQSRVSSIQRWTSSLERVGNSKEKQNQLKRAEEGLNYLITDDKIKQKLRNCLLMVNRKYSKQEAVNYFLCSCKVKQLSLALIRSKICTNMLTIIDSKNCNRYRQPIYKHFLQIVKETDKVSAVKISHQRIKPVLIKSDVLNYRRINKHKGEQVRRDNPRSKLTQFNESLKQFDTFLDRVRDSDE